MESQYERIGGDFMSMGIEYLDTMARRDFKPLLEELSQSSYYSRVSVRGARAVGLAEKVGVAMIFKKYGIEICNPEQPDFDRQLDAAINIFNRRASELR